MTWTFSKRINNNGTKSERRVGPRHQPSDVNCHYLSTKQCPGIKLWPQIIHSGCATCLSDPGLLKWTSSCFFNKGESCGKTESTGPSQQSEGNEIIIKKTSSQGLMMMLAGVKTFKKCLQNSNSKYRLLPLKQHLSFNCIIKSTWDHRQPSLAQRTWRTN